MTDSPVYVWVQELDEPTPGSGRAGPELGVYINADPAPCQLSVPEAIGLIVRLQNAVYAARFGNEGDPSRRSL